MILHKPWRELKKNILSNTLKYLLKNSSFSRRSAFSHDNRRDFSLQKDAFASLWQGECDARRLVDFCKMCQRSSGLWP